MSGDAKKTAHLKEHLPYEIRMLRYTLGELTKRRSHVLEWNVYFESFAVHARNLYDFLTNSDDSRNFKAKDFIDQFATLKTDQTKGTFEKLNSQVFHLGKSRPTNQTEKANRDHAKKVASWIEKEFNRFVDGLAPRYRSEWDWDNADPSKITLGDSVRSQSATASTRINSSAV